ncbi:MAG: Zinc/iron permease, partial [Candidatus Gallionella acididurans]
ALLVNLVSSLATFLGGVLAYYALRSMQGIVPVLLALAAASMIYVAVADLIPGLHKRTTLRDTLEQVALIALGISSIVLVQFFVAE